MRNLSIGLIALGLLAGLAGSAQAAHPPLVEKYLHSGELARGEQALEAALAQAPGDDELRLGLGFLQFVRGAERLCQSLHEYGMRPSQTNLPFLRLPIPENPDPNTITHQKFRRILDDFRRDLATADSTLAKVKDDKVKLRIRLADIRIDMTGKGKATDRFIDLLGRIVGRNLDLLRTNRDLRVAFDRGDVAWLRGYCHLLMAMTDFMLAFDGGPLWDCTAHLCFKKPDTGLRDREDLPLDKLLRALGHLEVREPDRLKRVRKHLLKVCALSRESWKHILAETDDEDEWLPNPRQTGALGIRVSQGMIDAWLDMMGEIEAALDGKKLVPLRFGGHNQDKGFNVRRFLEKPPEAINLIDWFQNGPGPYLEKGKMVDEAVWRRAERVFGGDFFGFAIWFN